MTREMNEKQYRTKIIMLYKRYEEMIKYLIVGGLTTVVSMVLFYGSTYTFLNGNDAFQLQIANIISWIGAVAFAYVTNRTVVFKSESKNILKEGSTFVASRLLTLFLDMGVMFIFATIVGINYNISKIISMVLVTIGNYVISKFLVFRSPHS